MEKSTKWVIYLSGPMTGIPQFNYPAFTAAASALRAEGYEVINPAEIDDDHTQKLAMQSLDGNAQMPWGQLIGRDIAILCSNADELVLLPGWEKSRGSLLEALAASFDGIHVSDMEGVHVKDKDIADSILNLLAQRNSNVHKAHKPSLLQARF